jgi:hypothetical protein
MVNAFTFDDGSPRSFSSRKAMYDWMMENGHVVLEGDDAPRFDAHVAKSKSPKAAEVAARISSERGI